MEPSNFNLKQAIDDYIGLIKNRGSLTSSDKDELTSHLHDSTEALIKQSLSEEESFIIACKRIGKVEVISDEYSKVNTSLRSSKVWAYLLTGFNLFYGIPTIVLTAISVLYFVIYKQHGTSVTAISMVTLIHILFITCLWSIVKYKRRISHYIEKRVEENPIHFIILTCIPLVISILFTSPLHRLIPGISITYPVHKFNSSLTEFSFYLAAMSIIGVFLSLVFSINRVGSSTLKTLFTRPSVLFLLSFGFAVELLAASTRGLYIDNIVIQATFFGLVYMGASFLISYYNEVGSVNRYIIIATALGLILEVSVGISADMGRGDTYFTAFFAAGLIAGVAIGRFLGTRLPSRLEDPQLHLEDN